jgi:thioredoxin-like negative regulator of GroEL
MLVLVGVLGVVGVRLSAAGPPAKRIHWQKDLDAAHQVSLRENKPILLVISADWCHHCRKLWRNTLNDPKLADHVDASFVPVHLDFDRNKRIAKALEVRSIPSSIVLSPRADLLGRMVGHVKPDDFRTALQDAARLQRQIEQARLSAHSNTP